MSYKRNYRSYARGEAAPAESGASETAAVIPLDSRKQVTVRKYNGTNLVDIREYYIDKASGEKRPGKKGISLTQAAWNVLLGQKDLIQQALDELSGTKTSTAAPPVPEAPDPKPKKARKTAPAKMDDDDSDFNEDDFEDVLNKELLLQEPIPTTNENTTPIRASMGSKRPPTTSRNASVPEEDVSDADD